VKKTTGFTLVELLVVVAIVGILAGIAVLRQRNITGRARLAAAAADARGIREAEATFHADSGRYADLLTLTRSGYAPQPSRGNTLDITLNAHGYSATVTIGGTGGGGAAAGGGCRLEVGASSDALACSADGVPGSVSGEVPVGTGVAPLRTPGP
jgi:prepilin-type N-terminal cleavage/methylation domain-containing protein